MKRRNRLPISIRACGGLALFLALSVVGCAQTRYADIKPFVQAHDQDVAATNYRIEPPDLIEISSPQAPELNGETQVIRQDGKISLKLIGEVKVSGMTPREAEAKIEELLARYYVNPKVQIQVLSYASKKIYIYSEVAAAGQVPFTGRDTLLDILSRCNLTNGAWRAKIKVIRPSPTTGEQHEIEVDADKMLQHGDLKQNFLLKEGDIIVIPPTPLAWVGLRVRELFFPVSPVVGAYTDGASVVSAPKAYRDALDGDDDGGNSNRGVRRLLSR
ncbi:MAG TPA: polysaccharide biosynthesis/export family protein [Phycisphaerae bacterium]|nr:polysaccharide biosynthesis/export family protein [Phycisphaerae bacterium]HRY68980.1 polysaccharide biosynthesis/export family protein [Phycisphaerae bacterium]HSA26046.1 polysaccharide biosynthesis/export family protein [Phycisphaerae bacterium]